jgi:periplasmic protein CpxP/Spy
LLHKTLLPAQTRFTATPQGHGIDAIKASPKEIEMTQKTNSIGAARLSRKPLIAAISGLIIAASGTFATFAHARGPEGMMGGNPLMRMERLLDEVEATEEQKDKIAAILKDARDDMSSLRDERQGMMKEFSTILSGATVDRAQLETARATSIGKLDEASKRVTVALADAAEVLNPEQRAELVKLLEQRNKARLRWGGRHGDQNP